MNLKDFDERISNLYCGSNEDNDFEIGDFPDTRNEIKSYLISKLREFGEGLKKQEKHFPYDYALPPEASMLGTEYKGYNDAVQELNAQIDKELKGLEE